MSLLSIFLVVFLLCICTNTALFERNHVIIRNALQHNKDLMVHCKSGDDDKKFHRLAPGAIYSFGFHDNIGLSTLFWCNVWQGPHFKHHQVFVAYKSRWYRQLGAKYEWEAREDGVYFSKDEKNWTFKYGWDVPHKASAPLRFVDEILSRN